MKLLGKVAFITGAASGIGEQIARTLANEGANIVIADMNIEGAKKVASNINDIIKNSVAMAIKVDVTNEKEVNQAIEDTVKTYGSIDILVSNAGIQIVHPIEEYPFEEWKKMQAIHGDGAFLTTKAAYSEMKKSKKGGQIIYIGSVHSHEGSQLKSAYCFAKHGLIGLSKVIAKEGALHKIHSYVVCPGFVKTPLVEKQIPEQAKQLKISEEQVIKEVMLKETVDGEFTTVEDVANLVLFLSQDNGVLTGQSINISHGWCMK